MTSLDARLLAAHDANDITRLVTLYHEAATCAEDDDARGFYLTHALVFALEAGSSLAHDLRKDLIAMGRDASID